jgi:toxin-antitoxin system PIN domain toxin
VIAVDTNVLVYAHREESAWHARAYELVAELAEGASAWAIPWPCVHEFLAVVTHPRIYDPPTPTERALEQVAAWLESPSVVLLAEAEGYWDTLRGLVAGGHVAGGGVHDARVAALCLHHGVRELWTADRDFGRYPSLRTRTPRVA